MGTHLLQESESRVRFEIPINLIFFSSKFKYFKKFLFIFIEFIDNR